MSCKGNSLQRQLHSMWSLQTGRSGLDSASAEPYETRTFLALLKDLRRDGVWRETCHLFPAQTSPETRGQPTWLWGQPFKEPQPCVKLKEKRLDRNLSESSMRKCPWKQGRKQKPFWYPAGTTAGCRAHTHEEKLRTKTSHRHLRWTDRFLPAQKFQRLPGAPSSCAVLISLLTYKAMCHSDKPYFNYVFDQQKMH